jgi:hypothetical protein
MVNFTQEEKDFLADLMEEFSDEEPEEEEQD